MLRQPFGEVRLPESEVLSYGNGGLSQQDTPLDCPSRILNNSHTVNSYSGLSSKVADKTIKLFARLGGPALRFRGGGAPETIARP